MDNQRKIYVRANAPVKYKLSRSNAGSTTPSPVQARPSPSSVISSPGAFIATVPQGYQYQRSSDTRSQLSSITAPVLVPPVATVHGPGSSLSTSTNITNTNHGDHNNEPEPPIVTTPLASSPIRSESPQFMAPTPKVTNANDTRTARAERKIMDLEISNTALLTINKFLEKKIKKQEREYEHLQSYVQSGEFLEGISFDTDSENDDDDDNEENKENIIVNLGISDNQAQPEPKGHQTTLDEKTRKAREISDAHIEFLKQSDRTNRILQKCLVVTETLLKEAQSCLETNNNVSNNDNDSIDGQEDDGTEAA